MNKYDGDRGALLLTVYAVVFVVVFVGYQPIVQWSSARLNMPALAPALAADRMPVGDFMSPLPFATGFFLLATVAYILYGCEQSRNAHSTSVVEASRDGQGDPATVSRAQTELWLFVALLAAGCLVLFMTCALSRYEAIEHLYP